MKQTTKPKDTKQSHLKRDLAGNVAALPLPTPHCGERGEGGWPAESIFTDTGRDVLRRVPYPSDFTDAGRDVLRRVPYSSDFTDTAPIFQEIAARRDEPLLLSPVIPKQPQLQITNLQTYDLIRVAAV